MHTPGARGPAIVEQVGRLGRTIGQEGKSRFGLFGATSGCWLAVPFCACGEGCRAGDPDGQNP